MTMIKFKLAGLLLFVLILFEMDFCCGRRTRQTGNMLEDFDVESSLPRFSQPIPNVTVTIGKDALLPCVVDNLRSYKVAWVRVDTQTILTIHTAVITRNQRITLSFSDHRSWFLQIKNTQESDRGWYMCQVNTDPMRSLMGYLEVVVPPQIIDQDTSLDLVAKEGSNVTLHCKAKGHPEPYVMWRREDNQEIHYNGNMVNVIDGEVFPIIKISRLHMGAYLCIASNGIPPSISKRVEVKVQFPPMMTIPHQLEGAYLGQDITIECQTEAHPKSINYWTTEKGDMIVSGEKYESFLVDTSYRMYMRLKIRNLTLADFGTFKCVAKNSLGETDGNIRLYEIATPPTTLPTTIRTTPFPSKKPKKAKTETSETPQVDINQVVLACESVEQCRSTNTSSPNDVHNGPGYDGQVSMKGQQGRDGDGLDDLDNDEMSGMSGGSGSHELFTTTLILPWLNSLGLGLSGLWTSLQEGTLIKIFQLDQPWVKPSVWKKNGAVQVSVPVPAPAQSPSSVHIEFASSCSSGSARPEKRDRKQEGREICSTSAHRSRSGNIICKPRSKNKEEEEEKNDLRSCRKPTTVSHADKEVEKNGMSTDTLLHYFYNRRSWYRLILENVFGYGSGINLMCLSLTLILIHFH